MNARHKLNQSHLSGAFFLAGVIGVCSQSWSAFAVTAVVLVGLSLHSGDIRLAPKPHQRPSPTKVNEANHGRRRIRRRGKKPRLP